MEDRVTQLEELLVEALRKEDIHLAHETRQAIELLLKIRGRNELQASKGQIAS